MGLNDRGRLDLGTEENHRSMRYQAEEGNGGRPSIAGTYVQVE